MARVLLRGYSSKTADEVFKQKFLKAQLDKEKNAPMWVKREETHRKRYGEWNPTRKLSRQQMTDIRDLKLRMPELKTIQIADFFKISPEAVRRILKAKWVPNEKEMESLTERATKRKLCSQERKKEAKEDPSNVASNVIQATKLLGPPKWKKPYKKSHKSHGSPEKRDQKRKNKPFTQSVGDLID